jgi:hypothetical protein
MNSSSVSERHGTPPSLGGGGSIGARQRADRGGVTSLSNLAEFQFVEGHSPHPAAAHCVRDSDPPPPGEGEATAAH